MRYACPDGEGKKKNGAREKLEGGGGRAGKGGRMAGKVGNRWVHGWREKEGAGEAERGLKGVHSCLSLSDQSDHREGQRTFALPLSLLISLAPAAGHLVGTCASDSVRGHIWGQNLAFTPADRGTACQTRDTICVPNLISLHFHSAKCKTTSLLIGVILKVRLSPLGMNGSQCDVC